MELIIKISMFSILAHESLLHERIEEQIEVEMKGIVILNVRLK